MTTKGRKETQKVVSEDQSSSESVYDDMSLYLIGDFRGEGGQEKEFLPQ